MINSSYDSEDLLFIWRHYCKVTHDQCDKGRQRGAAEALAAVTSPRDAMTHERAPVS